MADKIIEQADSKKEAVLDLVSMNMGAPNLRLESRFQIDSKYWDILKEIAEQLPGFSIKEMETTEQGEISDYNHRKIKLNEGKMGIEVSINQELTRSNFQTLQDKLNDKIKQTL